MHLLLQKCLIFLCKEREALQLMKQAQPEDSRKSGEDAIFHETAFDKTMYNFLDIELTSLWCFSGLSPVLQAVFLDKGLIFLLSKSACIRRFGASNYFGEP